VYSRNRAHLEQARLEFEVGNLYLNRKCTGAMMGVHPFGGIKLSGAGSKPGGPDYLLSFVEAKAIGERL
jgi:1-pyrroline-5-carboxylate dehydrogenase